MTGRPVFCSACRGYGALYVQQVVSYGDTRLFDASEITARPCGKCNESGYAHPGGPARSSVPILNREKRRKAGGVAKQTRARKPKPAPVVASGSVVTDVALTQAGEGGTAGSV